MTVQGSIVGTAAYAPPEQLMGNHDLVNERSDVYGLGAMLYELLTGKPPAQAATLEAVIAGDIPSPRSVQTQIPKPLEAICARAISRQLEARYATAAALGQEIERWLDDLPVQAFPEPIVVRVRRWIRSHQLLTSTAAAILLMSMIGVTLFSSIVTRNNQRLEKLNTQLDAQNAKLDEKNSSLVVANKREREQRERATKLFDDLDVQAKEASTALLKNELSEYQNYRTESDIETLVRAWRVRAVSDPLKEPYGRVVLDKITRGGRDAQGSDRGRLRRL